MSADEHTSEDWERLTHKAEAVRPKSGVPLSEEQILSVEHRYEVNLPQDYREFLKRIGDGHFGPRRFLRLEEGLTESSRNPFPLATPLLGPDSPQYGGDWDQADDDWERVPKGDGVMRLCEFGEYMTEAVLILNGPFCGKIWLLSEHAALYRPFGGSEFLISCDPVYQDWNFSATPRDYSFFEWYEFWLDDEAGFQR